jgi:hypothetical protein
VESWQRRQGAARKRTGCGDVVHAWRSGREGLKKCCIIALWCQSWKLNRNLASAPPDIWQSIRCVPAKGVRGWWAARMSNAWMNRTGAAEQGNKAEHKLRERLRGSLLSREKLLVLSEPLITQQRWRVRAARHVTTSYYNRSAQDSTPKSRIWRTRAWEKLNILHAFTSSYIKSKASAKKP